jgi:hypothetical protein
MLAKAKEVAEVTLGDDLLAKVRALEGDANRIAKAAEGANDLRTALAGVRELTRIVELLAKLRGELREAATVNITTAVGVQVVAMTLDEQEVRVRNAAAAISRLREKSVLGAGLTTAAPDGNK